VDGHDGHPLAPEFAAPLGFNDFVTQIAWAPRAAGAFLARTQNGRWLHWQLPTAGESPDKMRVRVSLLGINNVPNYTKLPLTMSPPAAASSAQRQNPSHAGEPASRPARLIAGKPITSRTAGANSRMLDLTSFYTTTLGGLAPADDWDADASAFANLPQGVVRIQ